jgi:hypothetical protein
MLKLKKKIIRIKTSNFILQIQKSILTVKVEKENIFIQL